MKNSCLAASRSDNRAERREALLPGTRLDRYEIRSLLGSGGMGEVYRAHDTRLGREVALKILPEPMASDPCRLARFEREAKAASAFSDPHAVAVFDVGREGAIPYFVSELVEGETLRDLLQSRSLSLRTVLELAAQIASGLAAAHERGVIHRDLKPGNILVSRSGVAKIADFGLARLSEPSDSVPVGASQEETASTAGGVVLGTVGYISPEQARGERGDGRSDVFSFGCVLYEMVTGRRAFDGNTSMDTLASILRDDPPPIRSLNPLLPEELDRIVRRCLEKSPERRFQSSRDLAFSLEGLSISCDELRVAGTASKQRNRLTAQLASALGFSLGLLRTVLSMIP